MSKLLINYKFWNLNFKDASDVVASGWQNSELIWSILIYPSESMPTLFDQGWDSYVGNYPGTWEFSWEPSEEEWQTTGVKDGIFTIYLDVNGNQNIAFSSNDGTITRTYTELPGELRFPSRTGKQICMMPNQTQAVGLIGKVRIDSAAYVAGADYAIHFEYDGAGVWRPVIALSQVPIDTTIYFVDIIKITNTSSIKTLFVYYTINEEPRDVLVINASSSVEISIIPGQYLNIISAEIP